jgi:hypothetical protein
MNIGGETPTGISFPVNTANSGSGTVSLTGNQTISVSYSGVDPIGCLQITGPSMTLQQTSVTGSGTFTPGGTLDITGGITITTTSGACP